MLRKLLPGCENAEAGWERTHMARNGEMQATKYVKSARNLTKPPKTGTEWVPVPILQKNG